MCVLSLASSRAISEACAESEERKLKKTCYRLNSARTALPNANYASVHGHRIETRRASPPPRLPSSSSAGLSPGSAFDPVSPAHEGSAVSGLHPPNNTVKPPVHEPLCARRTAALETCSQLDPSPHAWLCITRNQGALYSKSPALSEHVTPSSDFLAVNLSTALSSYLTLIQLPLYLTLSVKWAW